ncbi:MAG: selenocysteine-specific translation elongation factor [Deltaproteobacteria bacterium]|nr:MAG: selenocysteine-specific translation elongation factor [Deltaproteobacteria bacterium]
MKQIILGTAGHIDHGKTSLIKAVTGTDTDRLKEEKQRGITIELGFASIDLPSGRHVGIVDVPGHEKFVKNMVAGATGIDIVAMVIAADEGVMPQTREHMEICTLLGICHGLKVITKIDLVDEEWLELAMEDVQEFIAGTFLEDAPMVTVSSATGLGIPEFVAALDELSSSIPERAASGLFRLPVDRVFTMKGFGTVITGTLTSGHVQTGDSVMLYPSGITSRVRGIQVLNQSVEKAGAGMRTAINFQGLGKSSVSRGDVLSTPNALIPSYMVDVSLTFLASNKKPAGNRTRVRFHTGTSEVPGILILLDREELAPGDSIVAQLRLDAPLALVKDDRFVIRSYSPVRTIGGGRVLNPIPPKHKRFKPEVFEGLQKIDDQSPGQVIAYHVKEAGPAGVLFSHLKIMTNMADKPLNNAMQGLLTKKTVVLIDRENRRFVHEDSIAVIKRKMHDTLAAYHAAYPLRPGMPREELKSKFPRSAGPRLLNFVLAQMIKTGDLVSEEETVHLADHKISLGLDQQDIKKNILDAYIRGGLTPPYFKELAKQLDIDPARGREVLMLLVDEGPLIKVKEDLYFYNPAVEELKGRVIDFLKANEEMSTPQFKNIANVSRKYLIPLIEYFDSKNVTIRIGDIRKLRRRV